MIQLLLFLLVGALLFFSLYFLARRNPQAEGSAQTLFEARQALNALQVGLLPPELLGRIFAKEDLDYVLSGAPRRIQKLFFEQRKRLALSWVGQIREQVRSLRRFHLGSARFYAQLSLRTEMWLALDFTALLLACRALQVLLYFRGPYAATRAIVTTAAAAARVCDISQKSLAFLKAASASAYSHGSAGGPVAL